MKEIEIIKFLKENIEPIEDKYYGNGYRAAAQLTDGTLLPCVIFRNPRAITKLALRRFQEERDGVGVFVRNPKGYRIIVTDFITRGNRIATYDIDSISLSKFAFPVSILQQIHGETSMGWTGFKVKMKDGNIFKFGTKLYTEFFNMPEGYTVEDIEKIINQSDFSDGMSGNQNNQSPARYSDGPTDPVIYRERLFFDCFVEDL
jgi:hypothetical protein